MSANSNLSGKNLLALSLGALGVVYGDIGTSPLYAFRECFNPEHGLALNQENIFGVLSLVFWTLVLVINIKYMWFVMRADNNGEGGILSLMALAVSNKKITESRIRIFMITLGLFGSALLFGDGAITPAISVLSAVEGLSYLTPVFSKYVTLITVVIILILFISQRFGTSKIGSIFGPIMLIWFFTLVVLGLLGIGKNYQILSALNPYYALTFFVNNGTIAFFVLGSVFLVVTGGEALYADMGHFGKEPIRLAWFFVVLPALVINYFGQGAVLLENPEAIVNPFYMMAPKWLLAPLVVLSTMATVIASQALISGVFSLTQQAVQLGFWPRVNIIHTSSREKGQVYIPFINYSLLITVIWLVLSFKSSSELAAAYGIAVTATMLITTVLAFEVARILWQWHWLRALGLFGFFFILDSAFLSTNFLKISNGGWIPLAIGMLIYLLMSTWQKGRKILFEKLKMRSLPIDQFIERIKTENPHRVKGSAIFMSGDPSGVPVPLLHNLKHNKILHERIALLTIKTKEVPTIEKSERVKLEEVYPNIYRIIAQYGFMETPKIKHILDACRARGVDFHILDTTFVLGRETILPTFNNPQMSFWREKLFAIMSKNAERPTAFFKIPPNQVIEVGIQVEI